MIALRLCIFEGNNTGMMLSPSQSSLSEPHSVHLSIIAEILWGYLVEVVSSRFLKLLFFLSIINKYIVRRYFEAMQLSHLLVLASIDDSCLNQLLL